MRRRVSVDDAGVTVIDDAGSDRVAWVDLVAVTIRTTDAGPMHDDFLWQLHRVDGNILSVGSETDGMELLLERLQRLPGFDNEAVIAAASSTAIADFHCWPRWTVTLRSERNGADVRWLGAWPGTGPATGPTTSSAGCARATSP